MDCLLRCWVEHRESSGSPQREEAEALLKRRIDEKAAYRIGLLLPMLAESNVRRGFLEVYEVDLLVRALPEYPQGMVRFAYLTGWRLSEITGLRWEDVDLYNNAILLETSKNAQGRVLALRGEL